MHFQVTATSSSGTNIAFSLAGTVSDRFSLNPTGGSTVDVRMNQALDRDYPDGFDPWVFNIVADDETDAPTGYDMIALELVDINDNAPMFDSCCLVGQVPERNILGVFKF